MIDEGDPLMAKMLTAAWKAIDAQSPRPNLMCGPNLVIAYQAMRAIEEQENGQDTDSKA